MSLPYTEKILFDGIIYCHTGKSYVPGREEILQVNTDRSSAESWEEEPEVTKSGPDLVRFGVYVSLESDEDPASVGDDIIHTIADCNHMLYNIQQATHAAHPVQQAQAIQPMTAPPI